MRKKLLLFSGISAIIAVILGALAAHYFRAFLTSEQISSFQTANRYQWYHTLSILIICLLNKDNWPLLNRIGSIFAIGIVLFSGSIYLLATKELLGIPALSILGPITPIGGLVFISGWGMFSYAVYKNMFKTT
ncbi:MAG: DUF423 domain-containing protein [Flavobacteriales bacterium]|nr:DUF423 domain-containing protein [Flavobacteriales bacterium]